jgi:lipoprotein-anchoring transpeptidase ErfK/SrfK
VSKDTSWLMGHRFTLFSTHQIIYFQLDTVWLSSCLLYWRRSNSLEADMKRRAGWAKTRRGRGRILAVLTLAAFSAVADPSFAQTTKPASDRVSRVVLISIPDRKLAVIADGNVLATFSAAVGAEVSPSPTGEFQIVSRVSNPTYYRPGTVIPSGKDNPVGTRWVGLSQKGYGIHGTNAPRSVGHAASHGCIRLRNRDMERLFTMVRVGDVVEIHGKRDELVGQVFGSAADDSTVADTQVGALEVGQ